MAQTMPDALFRPIFVTATPPITYFIDYNYICYKYQLVFQKKKEEKLTYGPNDDRHICLGPFSSSPPFPSCMSQITIHICYKHQLVFKKNSLMAQTTPGALFRPIFAATAPPVAYFINYNYIYTINDSQFQKKMKKEKKTH